MTDAAKNITPRLFLTCLFFLLATTIKTGFSLFAKNNQDLHSQLAKAQKADDPFATNKILIALALAHWDNSTLDSAIYYFGASADISKKMGNANGFAVANINIGLIYSEKNDLKSSLKHFEKAFEESAKAKNKNAQAEALIYMGVCKIEMKRLQEAFADLENALLYAKSVKNTNLTLDCYQHLIEVAENIQAYEKALFYQKAYSQTIIEASQKQISNIESHKKWLERQNAAKNQELQEKQETIQSTNQKLLDHRREVVELQDANSKKESEIQLLSREKQIKELKIKEKELILQEKESQLQAERAFRVFLIALSVLLVSFVAVVYWMYRSKQRVNKELEDKNSEILQQKEEIEIKSEQLENAYEQVLLLSKIGQGITHLLTVEDIIAKVYDNVKNLVPADCFGIGLYNPGKNRIDYPGFIKNGKAIPFFYDDLGDDDSLSDWCFKNKEAVIIKNYSKEAHQYIPNLSPDAFTNTDLMESVLFFPLIYQNSLIGNITVQCRKESVYKAHHSNFMRNIATYTAIALENAKAYTTIEEEKEKSDELLLNILPFTVAQELKLKGYADPQKYDSATVLFTDFKGFTRIARDMPPEELVRKLDYCFSKFDEITKKYGLEKIKTIGDAYMCVGGLPTPSEKHAENAVRAALEIIEFIKRWQAKQSKAGVETWDIRVGIHTGEVVAGVVGRHKFAYDIWGDAVNTASRIETAGEAGKINISGDTYEAIKNIFDCAYRGKIEVKNRGEVDMYFVKA